MVRPSRSEFCQRRLFLQLTTCSKTEKVLFNLEEQAITKVFVVKVVKSLSALGTKPQTETKTCLKQEQADKSCPVSGASTHKLCSASLEDSPAARGLT